MATVHLKIAKLELELYRAFRFLSFSFDFYVFDFTNLNINQSSFLYELLRVSERTLTVDLDFRFVRTQWKSLRYFCSVATNLTP